MSVNTVGAKETRACPHPAPQRSATNEAKRRSTAPAFGGLAYAPRSTAEEKASQLSFVGFVSSPVIGILVLKVILKIMEKVLLRVVLRGRCEIDDRRPHRAARRAAVGALVVVITNPRQCSPRNDTQHRNGGTVRELIHAKRSVIFKLCSFELQPLSEDRYPRDRSYPLLQGIDITSGLGVHVDPRRIGHVDDNAVTAAQVSEEPKPRRVRDGDNRLQLLTVVKELLSFEESKFISRTTDHPDEVALHVSHGNIAS